ncbi:EAL domain-containing protein [bacterium]|nr:EAL domain-containing protein [bacterium]MBU1958470.1 EAL domain-containing protein [bacterium]
MSISILFILLLFPSRTVFMNYVEKSNTYNKQLIGLEYIEIINKFIKTVQIHRSLSKSFLNGDKTLIEEITDIEDKFYKQKHTLMDYDAQHLKILKSNQNFAKAIALFEVIKIDKVDATIPNKKNFGTHGEIVDKLIKTILNISEATTFSASKDLRINYLADMLQEKLLRLYEFSRQLKDSSTDSLNKQYILKEQKKILFSLSTDLSTLKLNLKENKLLRELRNYHSLEEQTTSVTYKLENILNVIDENILSNQETTFNNQTFLNKTTEAIESQETLYEMFNYTYKDTTEALKSEVNKQLWSLFMVFLSILMVALYIFIAFYQSITGNLKKLQTASEMISSGQTKIKLEVDKQDEIGNALLAFNTMSEKLNENISFLDGYKTAIDNSSIVSKTDLKGIITYVNKMFCDVSGYSRKELIGRSHNIVRHPDMPKGAFRDMWQTIQAKQIWKGVIKNRTKSGDAYIVDATVLPILDRDGEIIEYVAVRHNITELEKSKEEIKKQRTDLLTGLPNRNQLLEDLKTAIKPIVFYLNIDDFSGFNDFYGSSIGDNVLLNLAKTLNKIKKEKHFQLYKLQADQFILLFQEGFLAKNNFQIFFEELVEYIETKISEINLENQNRISISITSGAASYYAHDNYQKLILYSNIARKKAQSEHKKFLLFNHSMRKNEDYAKNIEWIKKIKEAIDEDRVVTYYQPILDNKTGKIVKYETLVRMIDRDGHPVSTQTFLEIAERAKFYPQITKIVIEKAFKTFENLPSFEFSINLTIDDILSKETRKYIYEKLAMYPNSHNVVFEITESEEVNDYKIINEFIQSIKKYGVKIAIDDFGSGYANFEHIISIDADFIKIDGSLVKNLTTDKNARIITEAIIAFSKKLGRKTITEYVHNAEVYQIVKDLGADFSQGFYLGVPSSEINY